MHYVRVTFTLGSLSHAPTVQRACENRCAHCLPACENRCTNRFGEEHFSRFAWFACFPRLAFLSAFFLEDTALLGYHSWWASGIPKAPRGGAGSDFCLRERWWVVVWPLPLHTRGTIRPQAASHGLTANPPVCYRPPYVRRPPSPLRFWMLVALERVLVVECSPAPKTGSFSRSSAIKE